MFIEYFGPDIDPTVLERNKKVITQLMLSSRQNSLKFRKRLQKGTVNDSFVSEYRKDNVVLYDLWVYEQATGFTYWFSKPKTLDEKTRESIGDLFD